MAEHKAKTSGKRPGQATVLRVVLACVLILVWVAVAGVGGPTFGKLSGVQTNDQASFLPATAEATEALEWQDRFRDSEAIPAVVLVTSPAGFDQAAATALAEDLAVFEYLDGQVTGPFLAQDELAVQLLVPISDEVKADEGVEALRALLQQVLPEGAAGYVTGPAGFSADLIEAFGGIDGILLSVALAAVLLILLLVYRSALLPFTVLLTSVMALCAAIVVVYYMADAGWIRLDGQSQGILSILVIGAATDYSLLLVARHKEALAEGQGRWQAVATAWRGSFEPILASGGTVTVGLLCLLFSDLNSNKALGPIAASGIIFSIIAALSFLPAVLGLLGRAAYWPYAPKPETQAAHATVRDGLWGRIANFVAGHSRMVWILTTLVLVAGALGMTQLKATGVPQSELVTAPSEARDGQIALGEHFPGGSGSPAVAVVHEEAAADLLPQVEALPGVDSAYLQAADGGPAMAERGAEPQVVQGRSLISITLADAADSEGAKGTVSELRELVHAQDPGGLVGGTTATQIDTAATAIADLFKIIPLILLAILVILMLLLRSILAPVLLVATTVLSYGTAMGVSALVFNHLFEFPGADPAVPLFGFVFLVALGVDYNIFLMTRVREEALRHGTIQGVTRGLKVTGGVITSAGVVLAATFAALAIIPIMFLVQLGFIVAFGVLLDTLIVRSLLVPALVHEVGRTVWWPSKLARAGR
ncbi:efflux RND transporter permease subunit [Glutamicibacter sp. MNS18]|uniref:MMPL family transporter n=1 Tax=Glutamicibacter sp. MNS18 TaxID=2989817 RepID=UPI0022358263|nr:MMPL family transporter [Glutamicibacter sp. MNS18]MCW4463968.1 efflux RND transporter permease subunit [Glutamicibacter sp. MNS18]